MSLHSDTLFWFRANQSFLFLLNAAYLAEKQQIPILVFGLLEPTIYYTTNAVGYNRGLGLWCLAVIDMQSDFHT
jgi:hypothetical protein